MTLPDSLLDAVLDQLGFQRRPSPSLESLREIYHSWCQHVPFDNVQKLVHLASGSPEPLPGLDPASFFENWLRHRSGGTCWAGSTALHSLLTSLGFQAQRCIATMIVVPDLPPNHGTVHVQVDGLSCMADSSILFGQPMLLHESGETGITHPAWGVSAARRDGLWHIDWRPLHKPDGLPCRLDRFGAEPSEYAAFYEGTRDWSPFNYQLTARRNRGDEVIGMTFGNAVTLRADGSVKIDPIDDAERRRRLVEDFGMSEELVSSLPDDRPTPPPPGSKTAAQTSDS